MATPSYVRSVDDRKFAIRPINVVILEKEIKDRYRQNGVDSKGVEIGNQEEKTKDWAGNKWREEEKLRIEKRKEKK